MEKTNVWWQKKNDNMEEKINQLVNSPNYQERIIHEGWKKNPLGIMNTKDGLLMVIKMPLIGSLNSIFIHITMRVKWEKNVSKNISTGSWYIRIIIAYIIRPLIVMYMWYKWVLRHQNVFSHSIIGLSQWFNLKTHQSVMVGF